MNALEPTTVQIPVACVKDWMRDMSGAELKIFLYILTHTYSVGRQSLEISLKDLGKAVGVAHGHLALTIKRLEEKGLLGVERKHIQTEGYAINSYIVKAPTI